MKKMAIALALLILLAGGSVGALKVLEIGPFAKSAEELAADSAADIAAGGTGRKKGMFAARPSYIEMPPLMIPLFEGSDLIGNIQILYKLEVYGNDNKKSVNRLLTRLNDALIRDFTYYIPRTLRTNQNLDVSLIKYRIILVMNRELGEDVVSDALIQAMNQVAGK